MNVKIIMFSLEDSPNSYPNLLKHIGGYKNNPDWYRISKDDVL